MLIRASGNFHWRNYFLTIPVITVDGVEQKDCIEADDEAGYVVRYRRGADGQLVANHDRYATERLKGVVVIAGPRKATPEERIGRAQTRRDRRMIRNVEIVRRNSVVGE